MKIIRYFIIGILFGIVMSKSEAISWYRTHEMFRFESFHMYGVIGTAVVIGAFFMWAMKKYKIKTLDGNYVSYTPKKLYIPRHLIAGTIFGLGWALVACPGPMYTLLGHGYWIFVLVIISATLGTFSYATIKHKLPH
ncbi:MAG: YeeE/YedE family protein [Saprospiraceae bacterium]|nr:YeeE/YedE family protein [Saprospiraceae bacterium]MCB9322435.1 YeeE/YedE family protein [Lewinellaceae bacterium]